MGSVVRVAVSRAVVLAICAPAIAGAQADPALLWRDATLYRDEWGVPHVYAGHPRALAFAFGYAQAEDHLEPMLFAYRVANGRAAEVLGEPYAKSDAFS
ncbi:MAG TPA: penicillin acylase family protein, partial [Candidatus Hydrogenedentes bacterium]|nr:penicillin acylase family protein [Candidatus Hydrogenedentota bacterium]